MTSDDDFEHDTDASGLFMDDDDEGDEHADEIAATAGQTAMQEAANAIEFVCLPVACTQEGKGAPLAMGIQRWWAQELASLGVKAAAPVFTALANQGGKKIPALMVFREPWTQERAIEGITRFPNAKHGLVTELRVEESGIFVTAKLMRLADGKLEEQKAWTTNGSAAELPNAILGTLNDLASTLALEPRTGDWQTVFGTKEAQAVLSFLVGLGNLSALQGRCVPTTPDQLLSPLMDAITRDPSLDIAMQALHLMTDILVANPVDQTAIPLCVQALGIAAQRRKTDKAAYHHLGVLFRRLGDTGSAVASFNQAFNIDPADANITTNFIDTLRDMSDTSNALKVAQFAVEHGNEHPSVLARLGALMLDAEQFDQAEPFLRRAIEEGKIPTAYGDLANVLWDRGATGTEAGREDREEGLSLLRQAVELPRLGKSTLDMLLDLHEEEGHEEATLLLLRAASQHPENPLVLRSVATMYLDGDDPSKARNYLESMLALPRRSLDDDAFARRAILALDMEGFDERYDEAIEQVRSNEADKHNSAALFLREIIAKEPRFWQPHLMLALAVRSTEGDGAALSHLMDAVRLRPNDVEIRGLIAAILRKQGRARDAVEHLRAVVALQPRDVDPVVQLATCMRDANMFDEARQVCQAALGIIPNHPVFKSLIESLPPEKQPA